MDEKSKIVKNENDNTEELKSQGITDENINPSSETDTDWSNKAINAQEEPKSKPVANIQQKTDKKFPAAIIISVSIIIVGIIAAIIFLTGNNGGIGSIGHTHTYENWEIIKEATCTSEGSKERYCPCGEKQTSTINKLEHNYGSWNITEEATCKNTGSKERICDCGYIENEVIPTNNNHSETIITGVAATCTSTGLSDGKMCTVCGKITVSQTTIAKSPHDFYDTITKPATSTSTGIKTTRCHDCSYSSNSSYSANILSSEEVYALAELCVGEITIYNKSGTAIALGTVFVYSSDGKLITNYHVIEGAYSAKVTLNEQSYTVNSILAYDKDIDLAVLKISASNLYTPIIQTEGIKGGSKVYAVGSSEGYTLSFSTGVIASPSRTFSGVEYIQHEAAISHGNSGGPLFNQYGEVIGINTLSNIDGQNLNFAISCNELDNLYFGSSLTMKQFYEKECNPFELIKNYVIENGTYDSSDGDYTILLDTSYSSDYAYTYKTYVVYDIADNELMFSLHINGENSAGFWVDSSLSGSYTWAYIDDYNYEMMGTITARTYTDNTLLGYSYNNISSSSLRSSVRELASSMIDIILSIINIDLYSSIGVSAADLGFISY